MENANQGRGTPDSAPGRWTDESRSAVWRKPAPPGVQIGKYQNKEQVCTKEAADRFSGPAPAPVPMHQRQPTGSQSMRSWSSIGRYSSGQQRVAMRPRNESEADATHPRRLTAEDELSPSRDREGYNQSSDME